MNPEPMNNPDNQPRTLRYGTLIETITAPDGSTTAVPQDTALLVDTHDEDTAARLAAVAYVQHAAHRPAAGCTIHVHVFRHPRRQPRISARQWTIDVYVDTALQTLH